MHTLTMRSEVTSEGLLRIEVPCNLPPGPVEVVLVVNPSPTPPTNTRPNWDQLYGLGKEVWQGIDAGEYVRELREDREVRP